MAAPLWIRVKDPETGHEFDRREDDPAVVSGRLERVKDKQYPASPLPRPAKHHVKLAGRTASRPSQSNTAAAPAPTEEN
jgi:hypothetical protein